MKSGTRRPNRYGRAYRYGRRSMDSPGRVPPSRVCEACGERVLPKMRRGQNGKGYWSFAHHEAECSGGES